MSKPAPPMFYRSSPSTWLAQLDSYFALHNVPAEEQYSYCVAGLPEDIAVKVIDPGNNSYNDLKQRLNSEYESSLHERVQAALANIVLAGRKPSTCVLDIKKKFKDANLTTNHIENIIKSKLLTALPLQAQTVLAPHMEDSLEDFTKIADAVVAVAPSSQELVELNPVLFNHNYNINNNKNRAQKFFNELETNRNNNNNSSLNYKQFYRCNPAC